MGRELSWFAEEFTKGDDGRFAWKYLDISLAKNHPMLCLRDIFNEVEDCSYSVNKEDFSPEIHKKICVSNTSVNEYHVFDVRDIKHMIKKIKKVIGNLECGDASYEQVCKTAIKDLKGLLWQLDDEIWEASSNRNIRIILIIS